MLYYYRIDIRKKLILLKVIAWRECMICLYCFFNHCFKFEDSVCTTFHDLTIFCFNITDIAIITVKNVDIYCIIHYINKSEAINLLENSVC